MLAAETRREVRVAALDGQGGDHEDQRTVGVVDDRDVDRAEELLARDQRADRIVYAPAAGPNDMRLARLQAQNVLDPSQSVPHKRPAVVP